MIPDPMSPTHNPEKKAKITLSEGLTVFFCLTVSLASLMALVIYVGFFWYLEQQRQIKGKEGSLRRCEINAAEETFARFLVQTPKRIRRSPYV